MNSSNFWVVRWGSSRSGLPCRGWGNKNERACERASEKCTAVKFAYIYVQCWLGSTDLCAENKSKTGEQRIASYFISKYSTVAMHDTVFPCSHCHNRKCVLVTQYMRILYTWWQQTINNATKITVIKVRVLRFPTSPNLLAQFRPNVYIYHSTVSLSACCYALIMAYILAYLSSGVLIK